MAEARAQELMAVTLPVVEARHASAWLVGGWVRDRLLGLQTHDYDFVVPSGGIATARAVADAVRGAFVVLDVERDTARVVVGAAPDVVYLDFAALRASDIGADLLARDYTVNAMAVPVRAWQAPAAEVIDPAGGRRDLEMHLLRAVSVDSFREDPLRMLRGVRLAAALGFELESQTAAWIERDSELLDAVSRERVRDELAQILALPGAERSLGQLEALGLLGQVLPEVARLRAVAPAECSGRNCLEHSLQTVGVVGLLRDWLAGETWPEPGWAYEALGVTLDPYRWQLREHLAAILPGGRSVGVLLTLAAALHDVGKGVAGRACKGPGGPLLGHDVLGASVAATALRRLCFSSAETVRVRLAVRNHMRPGQLVQETGDDTPRRAIYRFYRDAAPSGVDTVLLSLADHLALRGSSPEPEHWRRHLAVSRALLEAFFGRYSEIIEPPLVVDGHELMAALGLAPGPEVGELLDSIREAQAAGEVTSAEEALSLARGLLQRSGPL